MHAQTRTIAFLLVFASCQGPASHHLAPAERKPIRLITLDPGHFHAALVQKSMYPDVDSTVYVYAPDGPDVRSHLDKIDAYNHRPVNPTHWSEQLYTGPDFLQKMIADKKGNTVVLAGNNREKTTYILQSLQAGFHVLGDKPMVIDDHAFGKLKQAFDTAAARNLVLYDIMTERYEITSILQRELALLPAVFGALQQGSPGHPAVVVESAHRWYKYVSGNALTRPAWFFDVDQQGEGIVDVMTHLVDLVQWGCFPEQTLDYTRDIRVDHARHWTTDLTLSQFRTITKLDSFPTFLAKEKVNDTMLGVYANGEIDYRLRGVYVKATATWTYKAPPGADDTYSSIIHGTKADLVIRQDSALQYHPTLYIEPVNAGPGYGKTLAEQFARLLTKYPGISLQPTGKGWTVIIPDSYKEGHEAHFARVTEKFLEYAGKKDLPAWEVPNMIAKYYTTTTALALARGTAAAPAITTSITIPLPSTAPQSDTLTAGVFPPRPMVLKGATRDLSDLDVRLITLHPGQTFAMPNDSADHLLIVKDGNINVAAKTLGPGGVGLFTTSDNPAIAAKTDVSFYLFAFKSRSGSTQGGAPWVADWSDLPMKKTDKGESRAIFSQPTAWLKNMNMHATTLNPGEISHPQHMHRAEEILLLRSGAVRMHIANGYLPAKAGDLVFLPSGVPHDLENGNTGRTEYFALQWEP